MMKPEEAKVEVNPLELKIRETISQTVKDYTESLSDQGLKENSQEIIERLLITTQIIVYDNRLFITFHIGNNLVWIKDYYLYKTGKIDEYNISFCLDLNKKQFINYSEKSDDEYKRKLFHRFLNSVKIIDDTSDENLGKIHLELLKTRLFNKVVPNISKDEIILREEQHRTKIFKDINLYFEKISPHLYKIADDGFQLLRISFNDINELTITDNGKLPQFKDYPCSDGKIRNNFVEYVYFLFEKEIKRNVDDISDQDWIGNYLVDKCRKIYPHLHFSYETSTILLPNINLNMNIDLLKEWF